MFMAVIYAVNIKVFHMNVKWNIVSHNKTQSQTRENKKIIFRQQSLCR